MPAIYGGSRPRETLREEEMAEANFTFSEKWISAKHSSLVVGAMHVTVRREPRGWIGVLHDADSHGDPNFFGSREIWRDTRVWASEMDALSAAANHAMENHAPWLSAVEHNFKKTDRW